MFGSEARRGGDGVARRGARTRLPARAALVAPGRVEAAPVDDHVDVAGVGVDRHPAALARLAPAHEAAARERAVEQAGAVQRVGDGAGAVVAAVVPRTVPAAVLVRLAGDQVGGG